MENKPRSPDADESSYEGLLSEPSPADKRESMLRHSREILNSIIPDALEPDNKTEQVINIEHRPEDVSDRSSKEKYNVENTSSEMPEIEKGFESRPEKGEEDFEKKYETKDSWTVSRFSDLNSEKYINHDRPATPVSEVIRNIKVNDERIAIKTGRSNTSGPRSVSQLKVISVGFILGLMGLLILISQT